MIHPLNAIRARRWIDHLPYNRLCGESFSTVFRRPARHASSTLSAPIAEATTTTTHQSQSTSQTARARPADVHVGADGNGLDDTLADAAMDRADADVCERRAGSNGGLGSGPRCPRGSWRRRRRRHSFEASRSELCQPVLCARK